MRLAPEGPRQVTNWVFRTPRSEDGYRVFVRVSISYRLRR